MQKELVKEAETAIAKAKDAYPDLIWQGMAVKRDGRYIDWLGAKTWELPQKYIERSRNRFNPEHVATAIAFIREHCVPAKTPKIDSYWLKHLAEEWGAKHGLSDYVATGELIAAAVYLQLPVRVTRDGIKVYIATRYKP
jgi:hypothetical protein